MPPKSKSGFRQAAGTSLGKILNHVLREECFLLRMISDYRVGVTGPNLYSLHRLFDEQRRQLDYWLDQIVDRTRSIGVGVKNAFDRHGRSQPHEGAAASRLPAGTMLDDLLTRHEKMAEQLEAAIDGMADPGMADLLARLREFHETTAWMLRTIARHGDGRSRVG